MIRDYPKVSTVRLPLPKIMGRGRKAGTGPNIDKLRSMKPGYPMVDVPFKKMESFRYSARMAGISIKVRAMPDGNYMIFVTK